MSSWIELDWPQATERLVASNASYLMPEEAPPEIALEGDGWALSIAGPGELTWDSDHEDDVTVMLGMKLPLNQDSDEVDETYLTVHGDARRIVGGHLLVDRIEQTSGSEVRLAGRLSIDYRGDGGSVSGRLDASLRIDM